MIEIHSHKNRIQVAYFSMEVGLEADMPTYSGGLGVLAGDILRAAADLSIPMVGVTLLHRKGYFKQKLDALGNQQEDPVEWYPEEFLEPLKQRIKVTIGKGAVSVRAWRYVVHGASGHDVPVLFLDTALPENTPEDRALTDHLYGGDDRYRLCQEVILGMGGLAMLRALGYKDLRAFHMNEGHSSLLALALMEERLRGESLDKADEEDVEAVRQRCIFTTHTPVPAGHDQFEMNLVHDVLGRERTSFLKSYISGTEGKLNTTSLALSFSRYVNGVSSRHEEISKGMFPQYPINSVTNGVHGFSWTSAPFRRLYDQYMPEWRYDNLYLRYAVRIPRDEILSAHIEAKKDLLTEIKRRTAVTLDPGEMVLGFARRATAYKRAALLLSDPDRLRRIVGKAGPLQIIYAGKAHPRDKSGQELIREIYLAARRLSDSVRIVYLEDYGMELGKMLCAGVDLWLNTPEKPREASGTSGMKAAMNGVPSLSVLDGWWIEGHVEGITGWVIGDPCERASNPALETESLYDKLENVIVPMFYKKPKAYAEVMRFAIALNGSFFNAQRMMGQYLKNAYLAENGNLVCAEAHTL
ncbi:MAG: alpha-glucan family phosphorylase [Planctomycetota bacterium]